MFTPSGKFNSATARIPPREKPAFQTALLLKPNTASSTSIAYFKASNRSARSENAADYARTTHHLYNNLRMQGQENLPVIGASLSRGSLRDVTQTTSLYMTFYIYRLYYPRLIFIGQGGIDYGGSSP
jgi:hypothetical protein